MIISMKVSIRHKKSDWISSCCRVTVQNGHVRFPFSRMFGVICIRCSIDDRRSNKRHGYQFEINQRDQETETKSFGVVETILRFYSNSLEIKTVKFLFA